MLLRKRGELLIVVLLSMLATVSASTATRQTTAPSRPLLVAHRGASGHAPEHTLTAYNLAISQGADFVEQDLHVTKDGHLICLHDPDLARTTNVSALFPDRARQRDPYLEGNPKRGWYAVDFTLAEIKRLEASLWFHRANPFAGSPKFVKEPVPTLQESIETVGNRAGLYIEIKNYEFYKSLGYDVVEKLAAALKRNGFERKSKAERVFIQSFSKECLLKMRDRAPLYARIQLLPMEIASRKDDTAKATPALASEVAEYAQGVGPSKTMIRSRDDVAVFHAANLLVHAYTFRGSTTAVKRRPLDEVQPDGSTLRQNIIADIERYLDYGIDGGFTDYPALWREALADRARRRAVRN